MNKQIIRVVSFVILPLLIAGVGAAVYFLPSIKSGEVKAAISLTSHGSAFDLFKAYPTWPTSGAHKTGTAADWLHTMSPGVSTSPSQTVDVNGDGLLDILIHHEFVSTVPSIYNFYYGILLNRGDLTFDLVYKCVYVSGDGPDKFYGECAQ